MNTSAYKLEEIQKTVVALLVAALSLLAYFIAFEPGLDEAIILTVEAAFGVAAVFLSTNYTVADVDKAVKALLTSGITLASFFTTVAPDSGELIIAVAAALVQVLGVYFVPNQGRTAPGGSILSAAPSADAAHPAKQRRTSE